MKIIYFPDKDSVLLKFGADLGVSTVNITHLAFGWLNEHGRIRGFSIDEASRQLGVQDLVNHAPRIGWRVCGADYERNGGTTTDLHRKNSNDLSFVFYPDSGALLIEFTEGPSTYVVDITNIDLADINADGSLNSITISQASEVLGRDDLAYNTPEITWQVAPVTAPVT